MQDSRSILSFTGDSGAGFIESAGVVFFIGRDASNGVSILFPVFGAFVNERSRSGHTDPLPFTAFQVNFTPDFVFFAVGFLGDARYK